MVDVYLDLSRGSGGSGTASDPFGSLRSVKWSDNLRLRFLRGKVHKLGVNWSGIQIPTTVGGGIEITDYGDADGRAILDGGVENYVWTRQSGDIWRTGNVSTTAGVVLYAGVSLNWINWKSQAATLGAMYEGSYAYDHANATLYVWLPGNANPNGGGVSVATCGIGILASHPVNAPLRDLRVTNVQMRAFSRQGSNLENVVNAEIISTLVNYCGGDWSDAGYYLGGGLQCSSGCRNILYERNVVHDTYDSPLSPQLYNANQSMSGITYRRNTVSGFALAGVEIAIWSSGCTISNVVVEDNYIFGGGTGFSGIGDNVDNTCGIIMNRGNESSSFSNIRISGNVIKNIDYAGVLFRNAETTSTTVSRNIISNCRYGIRNYSTNPMNQRASVTCNEVSRCTVAGIEHNQRNSTSSSDYLNNTLADNGSDNLLLAGGDALVQNNLCYGAAYGIRRTAGTVTERNNNAFGAKTANFQGLNPGAGSTQINPRFQDAGNHDYQLPNGSTLVAPGAASGTDLLGRRYRINNLGCYAANVPDSKVSADLAALTAN